MWFTLRPQQALLVGGIILVMATASLASTDKPVVVSYLPETLVTKAEAPIVTAKAYAIFDVKTGSILVSSNSKEVLPIASVTKLVTAATVLRDIPDDKNFTVVLADTDAHGRAGRLSSGQVYTAHELLFPLLLESSNDAAAVFERETNGKIVNQINQLAKNSGAKTFSVVDASGISDSDVASVEDLVKLVSHLYADLPHLFDITQLSKRAGPFVSWVNNNPVRGDSYKGGKHGYTDAAGRTLVAIFEESFTSGKREVGYILLGSDNLVTDTATLREFVAIKVSLE